MDPLLTTLLSETSAFGVLPLFGLCLIVLLASVIRGYAGFGFSAIVVAAGSLFIPTREVVPLVLLLEIIASVQMAFQVWRDIHWKLVLSILAGAIVFIPLGQWVLLWVAAEPMRLIASLLLLLAVGLMATGRSLPVKNHPRGWLCIGMFSGFMNGLLAMGGMWAMIFLLSAGVKIIALRASLVALFFITDLYAVITGSSQGLINDRTLMLCFWSTPILLIGVWLGARQFSAEHEKTYKKVVLGVLTSLSLLLLARVIYSYLMVTV